MSSRRSHRSSRIDDNSSTASDVSEEGSIHSEDSLGATKSSNASSTSSKSSSKRKKKPSGSFGSRGDMLDDGAISKAKQAQLERELRTVDTVISEMEELELCPEDGILYVMTNSVDVQRIANLQQMSKHIDTEDKGKLSHLLLHLLVNIPTYAPHVQVACAGGISDLVPSLDEELLILVYTHTKKVLFAVDANAFANWSSLFFLTINHIPAHVLRGDVFDFLASLSEQRMSEKERRFACKLITCITSTDKSLAWLLLSSVQKLALDPLPSVRKSLAECLWAVLEALPRVSVREECIVNPLSRLLLDTSMDVSTATFKVFVQLLTVMDEGFVASFLFPIMLRYTVNAPPAAQDAVYANFGKVVYYSRQCFTKKDFENILVVYTRMCRNANEQCRKHCASNFLAMCSTFNHQPTLLPKLFELLTSFVTDTSVAVRRSVAAGFHELFGLVLANVADDGQTVSGSSMAEGITGAVAAALGGSTLGGGGSMLGGGSVNGGGGFSSIIAAGNGTRHSSGAGAALVFLTSSDYDNGTLSPIVTQIKLLHVNALQLMDDSDLVVRERLFNHVGIYLRSFSEMYRSDVAEKRRVLDSVIPPLIKFEQAITTNWRKLSQLLKYFDTFPKYFSFDRLERDLVPMLVSHLVNGAVALKKKIAVTIATFLHTCGTKEEAERTSKAIHTLRLLLCGGSSKHRVAFVFFVEGMATVFSSTFIAMYLLGPLCKLREDTVPSVRSHLGSILPLLLSIPNLIAPKAESEIVHHLSKDKDPIVAAKARQAKMLAKELAYDGQRDASLAKSEAILLTRDVFKFGWDEAASSAATSAATYMISASSNNGPNTSSGMSSPLTNSPSNDRGGGDDGAKRRQSRSPGRKH